LTKKIPEQSVIVWDLETMPDLATAARMLDMGTATDLEVREALGPGFPKHPLHKIVCIGALVASRQPEGWHVDALGGPHIGERTEAKLISDFIEKIGQLLTQLITFNGHSFDLPVLRYRAMANRVSAAAWKCDDIFIVIQTMRWTSATRWLIRARSQGEAGRNQQDIRVVG
jgi:predicted PolB exonuclease-like 3'-5' exonuclease